MVAPPGPPHPTGHSVPSAAPARPPLQGCRGGCGWLARTRHPRSPWLNKQNNNKSEIALPTVLPREEEKERGRWSPKHAYGSGATLTVCVSPTFFVWMAAPMDQEVMGMRIRMSQIVMIVVTM